MESQNIPIEGSKMPRRISETSAQSHAAIGNKPRQKLQNDIFDICVQEQRKGASDLSGQEVRRLLEAKYSLERGKEVRVDMSSITAPIGRLVTAGRLLRVKTVRQCSVTSQNIHPLRVPATQARLMD